ncbi:MAG: alpha/beta hydrolase [Casimicrobiaceae bacterium]
MAATVIGVLAACGTVALQHEESRLVFRVDRDVPGWYTGMPDGVQEFDIPVAAAAEPQRIHAWWWPAAGGKPDAPAILYLHGARWSLTGQLFRIAELRDFGFSVLAIDYRGFGKSDGDLPTEKTVYEDAHAAWNWLAARQPDPARRFIYGHSLGGAVAIDLAASLSGDGAAAPPAAGLIVESSFTSLEDMAKALTYPWLPVGLLLSQKFDSATKMAKVRLPVLIVHGEADRIVPARFSEELYQAAMGPKKLLLIEGGTHNNSMRTGAPEYRSALGELFGLGAARTSRVVRSTRRAGAAGT